jgi:peptidoglycan/LPS O-acetylase OafA/YrhL
MKLKHEPALDGLRALAVLGVIAFHARAPFALGGARGVDVFFVLSGYLITTILSDRTLPVAEFWRRRFVRLMPALIAMVVIATALMPLLSPQYAARRWQDALFAVTYTMDLPMAVHPWDGPFMHTWSLALEMQFYLVWPFVLPWLARRRPALALLCLWVALTILQWAVGAYTPITGYYLFHISGLALGAALAFMPVAAPALLGWGAIALILAGFAIPGIPTVFIEAATGTLIAALRRPSPLRAGLSWKPLVQVGVISYGVYLWHFPIHCAVEHTVWRFRGPVALLGGIGMATASYSLIERPVTKWLRPQRVPADPAVASL